MVRKLPFPLVYDWVIIGEQKMTRNVRSLDITCIVEVFLGITQIRWFAKCILEDISDGRALESSHSV